MWLVVGSMGFDSGFMGGGGSIDGSCIISGVSNMGGAVNMTWQLYWWVAVWVFEAVYVMVAV